MILIVSKSKKKAENYSELFLTMGYIAYGTTASAALNEISPLYHAVIFPDAEEIIDLSVFLSSFNAKALKIPIFTIGGSDNMGIALALPEGSSANSVIKKITRYLAINELSMIGDYACAGFDASVNLRDVFYFDRPLGLTKTERLIFRYLSATYPIPRSSEDIIRYCSKPSHRPAPSSVRAHISSINKKFKAIMGRSIIEHHQHRGYLIITPQDKKRYLR